MKISASIYAGNVKLLTTLVKELDAHHIDMLHVDFNGNQQVFDDIVKIREISDTPIDLHIIHPEPEIFFDRIQKLKIEFVSFQYENLKHLPLMPKQSETKFGLSIVSSTSIDVFDQAVNDFDFVMMMSTVPGESGGAFNKNSFQKIIDFKQRFPHTRIHVDGGVNSEIAYILRLLGVHTVVSGSYLLNHESLGAGILSFYQSPKEHKSFSAYEFAIPVNYLPVIKERELSFNSVLQTIEKGAQGFVLVTDEQGKLTSVVSNADVRRGILKNMNNMAAIPPIEFMNRTPVTISPQHTVTDILRLLNELNFIVLFLPVVDENNFLKGAVLLNNLTRV